MKPERKSPARTRYAVGLERMEAPAATRRLLATAEKLVARSGPLLQNEGGPELHEFTDLYRDWLLEHRGAPGTLAGRFEKGSFVLHSVIGAETLDEALKLFARFNNIVWGPNSLNSLRDVGDNIALVIDRPTLLGEHGLIRETYFLHLFLSQLEFLTGGPLDGIAGTLRQSSCVSSEIIDLLFDHSLHYDRSELALVVPKQHLSRAITARADEIGPFFEGFLQRPLCAGRRKPEIGPVVADILRHGRLHHPGGVTSLKDIAARLGCSPSTLHRRLRSERTSFREIKKSVLDDIAKNWLAKGKLSVDEIAWRLGYSDVFSFSRSFKNGNGCSPSAYRHWKGLHRR